MDPRPPGPFGSASINPLPHEIEGAAPEPVRPFSAAELRGALLGPHRVARLVLTERARLAASVAEQEHLGLLVAVLLMASLVLALPFGAVLGLEGFWRVSWLLLSLLVGGQWAWYLRPFFGVASISAEVTPFCLGTLPDYRGATSFFEAVLHLVDPPPLPQGFYLRAWGH